MTSSNINDHDYDSPGYEFLRLHRNMMNLYYKLVALDYQRDFCPTYKCPSINKYYFSCAQSNSFEQQYLFISLCSWLIRDKCQMNFEMELEDMSSSISVVYEALRLLHDNDELDPKFHIRMEQGYGPEVVYALSCLADRALELVHEHDPQLGSSPDIRFHNKQHDQTRMANSITIGQPIVGGSLTTRALGKYFIEDSSLILDYQGDDDGPGSKRNSITNTNRAPSSEALAIDGDWLEQVDKIAGQLELANWLKELTIQQDWQEPLRFVSESRRLVQSFTSKSESIIKAVESRINRQMQVVSNREKFLQTNLRPQLEIFLQIWRDHSTQTQLNKRFLASVNGKTDMFESYNTRLKLLANDIQLRNRELNDGSKLKNLEAMISALDEQTTELDVRIGLLMAALAMEDT